jgi:hypothetical protein
LFQDSQSREQASEGGIARWRGCDSRALEA